MLIPDRRDFKAKCIVRNKKGHCIVIKASIYWEESAGLDENATDTNMGKSHDTEWKKQYII